MIVITVNFPEKFFLSHGVDGKAIPFPAPTQVLCSFLSTGQDDNEDFISALDSLSHTTPTIVCGYTPDKTGRQRVSTIGEIGRYREGVSTTNREGASPSTFLNGVNGYTGIKAFSTSDDRYIIPGDVYYVYDMEDDEESIVNSLSPYVGMICSVGKNIGSALFDIAVIDSPHKDPLHAAYEMSQKHGSTPEDGNFSIYTPWKVAPTNFDMSRRLVLDTPGEGYISEMIQRYYNLVQHHPINVINTTYTYCVSSGSDKSFTLGFSPQENWDASMKNIIARCKEKNPQGFNDSTTYFIPHLLYDKSVKEGKSYRNPRYKDPLYSVTMVTQSSSNTEDLFMDFMLSCIEECGDNIYQNESIDNTSVTFSKESTSWKTVLPYQGHKSSLATQLSIMGYVKKSTGLDFDDFAVSLSPCLYAGYEDYWNVHIDFSAPQTHKVSISQYNHLIPVDSSNELG